METMNFYGSICLTDIPKDLITVGKNGKKYLPIVVNARREASQYGMTHYIKARCKKEQQKQGVNYYIGDLRPSTMQGQAAPPSAAPPQDDDLPW